MPHRTLRFWIRAIPRTRRGKPSQVVQRIYRTKAGANKARKRDEQVLQARVMIWSEF